MQLDGVEKDIRLRKLTNLFHMGMNKKEGTVEVCEREWGAEIWIDFMKRINGGRGKNLMDRNEVKEKLRSVRYARLYLKIVI